MTYEAVREYTPLILAAARNEGLRPSMVAAIMGIESHGNAKARSPMNTDKRTGKRIGRAQGLMQILPTWFGFEVGPDGELTAEQEAVCQEPERNINLGAFILGVNMRVQRDEARAAAAYFGAVDEWGNIIDACDVGGVCGPEYVRLFQVAQQEFLDLDNLGQLDEATKAMVLQRLDIMWGLAKDIQATVVGLKQFLGIK